MMAGTSGYLTLFDMVCVTNNKNLVCFLLRCNVLYEVDNGSGAVMVYCPIHAALDLFRCGGYPGESSH